MVEQHLGGANGGCVPKTGLARLRPVEEAVEDCLPRLVKAGPSILLLSSTPEAQATAPRLNLRVRKPDVFGASVTETGEETRVPVAPTNHCIRTVRPSTHNSSRWVGERCLLL